PTADRRPPTADRRPPTADRRPPTADRRPPTAARRATRGSGGPVMGDSLGGQPFGQQRQHDQFSLGQLEAAGITTLIGSGERVLGSARAGPVAG
ncbi:hypothetical protein, partial [Nonomuraea sp. NPDC049504]|uniref:hypothetical protein n=1 Tax=Nonomuraea sp. NPDC049504 TaxID=3154729 RepID=UPI00341EEC1F